MQNRYNHISLKNTLDGIVRNFHKVTLGITIVLFVILSLFVLFFLQRTHKEHLLRLSDSTAYAFRNALAEEMEYLLAFSLALCENGDLKEALVQENESAGYKILRDITQRFEKHTHLKTLRLQVLTPDFFIFARSWNKGFEGMPIWWFRDDLETFKNNKQPKVGIETGRLLTFKSTIPIRNGNKIVGYLEVIRLLDEFSARLREQGIELFALMDEKYLEKATLMSDFPMLFGKVIANQNYHFSLKQQIEKIDIEKLKQQHYLELEKDLCVWEPMYNGRGDKIGNFLLILPPEMLSRYQSEEEQLSIFKPFSNEEMKRAIVHKEDQFGSFKSGYDRDLIGLLPKLRDEDKTQMEKEAREILGDYTKNELIDIILSNKHQEKKHGAIE